MKYSIPLPPHIEGEKEPEFYFILNEEGVYEFLSDDPITEADNEYITITRYDDEKGSYWSKRFPAAVEITDDIIKNNKLPPELIEGIARTGSKGLIQAPSKSGKSYLTMHLAFALSSGGTWLGRKCRKSKVLYIDTEMLKEAFIDRYGQIKTALKANDNYILAPIKGYTSSFKEIYEYIVELKRIYNPDIIIIDPIYKLLNGSENASEVVAEFCQTIDLLGRDGTTIVFVHHHRKGDLSNADSQDRSSGSGVFARDVDWILDLIRIKKKKDEPIDPQNPDVKAYRASWTVRSFRTPPDQNLLFYHPVFEVDVGGLSSDAKPDTKRRRGGDRVGEIRADAAEGKRQELLRVFNDNPELTLSEAASHFNVSKQTIVNYEKKLGITLKRRSKKQNQKNKQA